MPISKPSAAKATEAATFRFTREEKRLLEFMAQQEKRTLTDLIRTMIAERASALDQMPSFKEAQPRRRPGRPRKIPPPDSVRTSVEKSGSVPPAAAPSVEISPIVTPAVVKPLTRTSVAVPSVAPPPPSWSPPPVETLPISTFGELTIAFRRHFSGRAEGTRSEFEETIVFLEENFAPDQLLADETPLSHIDLTRLNLIRDRIKIADIRFPRKNLYLTYIRMMLQFALKQEDSGLSLTPTQDLPPFTAKEIADAWSLSMKTP